MKQVVHLIAAVIATLCIAVFFISSIAIELTGDTAMIAALKSQIVMPGLFILVPAMALTGASGFILSKGRKGGLIGRKLIRMRIIAANGLLVLLPAAIYLDHLASAGEFGTLFYLVQTVEFLAGGINLTLMVKNMKDGIRLTRSMINRPAS